MRGRSGARAHTFASLQHPRAIGLGIYLPSVLKTQIYTREGDTSEQKQISLDDDRINT